MWGKRQWCTILQCKWKQCSTCELAWVRFHPRVCIYMCVRTCVCVSIWICSEWSDARPQTVDYSFWVKTNWCGSVETFALIMTTSTTAALAWPTQLCRPSPFYPSTPTPTPNPNPTAEHAYTDQCLGQRRGGEGVVRAWLDRRQEDGGDAGTLYKLFHEP